ncbi:xanthine dehydrogenase/oxidase isoform X2 [Nematostella vectensis]|uniref:xanthine dehydrogenase/oxidase isoform X2 n=1 Tax=Nematostella vectensis TaxID=45351 RepID=UPI002076D916|nr:xanthine dehydrogenase/oxidase isoform X2 [Nematostella vectensis]
MEVKYLILHHRPQPTATERSSLYSGYNKRILEQTFGGVVNLNNLPEQLQVISFTLNGRKCLVHNPDTKTTLNEWIRSQPGLKGTKVMCKEAGCGVCVVAVKRKDPRTGHYVTKAVNSCLCPLYTINGSDILTTEGIGNRLSGFHVIQKRLAEHNGSQCGFCSPGMVMNMYSLLKEDIKPSKDKIEESFDGNICRCTGYRPILDAMKSFAANADPIDIEELDRCASNSNNFSCSQNPVPCNTAGIKWYAAHSLAELYALLDHHSNDNVRMMAGNTGKGIFKDEGPVSVYIDINDVPELQKHLDLDGYFVVGGGVSLTSLMAIADKNTKKSAVFPVLSQHLRVFGNTPVRNLSTIAGNLMLAHDHSNFPSDLVTIMSAIGGLVIVGGAPISIVNMKDFLSLNMHRKVLLALAIPKLSDDFVVRSYKITPRSQNAHAYVNGCLSMPVNRKTMMITSKPKIVFGGIRLNFLHATKTEEFLLNKRLTNPNTLKGALEILDEEIVPDPEFIAHNGSTVEYHKNLTKSLFYKFYVAALGSDASSRVRSAAGKILHERAVSSGRQSFDTKPARYPVSKPIPKLASKLQASGEAQYTDDIPFVGGELHAAFVISTLGNCKLDQIDTSEAMKMPGVVRFIDAKDIPGDNYYGNAFIPGPREGVFCERDVLYPGHALGVIIADTQRHADEAAVAVKIAYKDVKPPILSIQDAIKAKSFAEKCPWVRDINVGDVQAVFKTSDHVISGQISAGGQHHYHMETQVALSIPDEDGMKVYSACQGPGMVQSAVARVLGIPASHIDVITRRLGGSFGGKASRANHIACACALAAKVIDRPVRLNMNFNTQLTMCGGRHSHMAKYKVSFDDKGVLLAVELDCYSDTGCTPEDSDLSGLMGHWDNLYFCQNWKIRHTACLTTKSSRTWCRAPGRIQAVFFIESIMEHVARKLNKTPEEVREINLYRKGQITPLGYTIPYCNIRRLWKELQQSAEFAKRKVEVESFNKANRWRKRGLALCPGKFNIDPQTQTFTVLVTVYKADGTVAVTHGGIEMGQGINVKVAQVAARTLGIPMEKVTIKQNTTHVSPNGSITGGSITSDLCCKGTMEACEILNRRLVPVKEQMKKAPWPQMIASAALQKVDLSVKHMASNTIAGFYVSYGVALAEAEIDVLTGERLIKRCDILFDCGESINPDVDVGQVEGAFMMGVGLWLHEKQYFDHHTGQELSTGTWTYKPPTTKDIPIDFRVALLKDAPNPLGVLNSKASGEPPATMACSCLFAVKHAIEAARKEIGKDQHFTLDGPATVEHIQLHCLVDHAQMTL